MVAARNAVNAYLTRFDEFEAGLGESAPLHLQPLRRAAINRFKALGFPTSRDEEWRFTNVAPLVEMSFVLGPTTAEGAVVDTSAEGLAHASFPIPHAAGTFLVFENGHRPELCKRSKDLPEGVLVCSLAEAVVKYPGLVGKHLARHADFQTNAFTALNTAFLYDGAFVYVPDGQAVAEPICLVFSAQPATAPLVWHRRCLLVIGAGGRAAIVESYDGQAGAYFTNGVTEIVVGAEAVVDYHRVQKESKEAFHIAAIHVLQERGSRFTSHQIDRGGALSRTGLNILLNDEGCDCILNGLYRADDNRLVDNHTRIDHARPRCTSRELYKGILSDRAHGVFNGTIYVHPDAQKTDAKQTNQTLLLSDDAVIDAKPQLEIHADDVKCTHGATIGQLDEEAIFYLRTRGIERNMAERLLAGAFANDIIGRIQIEPLRAQLEASMTETPEPTLTVSRKEGP